MATRLHATVLSMLCLGALMACDSSDLSLEDDRGPSENFSTEMAPSSGSAGSDASAVLPIDAAFAREALRSSPAAVLLGDPDPFDRYQYSVGVMVGADGVVVLATTLEGSNPETQTESSITGFDLDSLTTIGPTWSAPAGMRVTGIYDTGNGVWVLGAIRDQDDGNGPVALFGDLESGFTQPAELTEVFAEPAFENAEAIGGWLPGDTGGLFVRIDGEDVASYRRVYPVPTGGWDHTPVSIDVLGERPFLSWAIQTSEGRQLFAGDLRGDTDSVSGVVFELSTQGAWTPSNIGGLEGVYLLSELDDGSLLGYGWGPNDVDDGEPSRYLLSTDGDSFDVMPPATEDALDVWSFAADANRLVGFGSDSGRAVALVYRPGG